MREPYKILILGCGNIGAGYDFTNEHVLTHAKAFYQRPDFQLTVADRDQGLAEKVAQKYNAACVEVTGDMSFADYDCISICTPTTTHSEFLLKAFADHVPLVICEKPVASTIQDLDEIMLAYKAGSTKVLVNYMRRFLPAMQALKNTISGLPGDEKLTNISIRYQRGFVNNASHAWDLIEFLMGEPIDLTDYRISRKEYDAFEHDPTLTLQGVWNEVNVNIIGLTKLEFGCFEIDMCFQKHRVQLTNAGDRIDVFAVKENNSLYKSLSLKEPWGKEDCMGDYMIPVAELASGFLRGEEVKDNFESAISLNKKLLRILSN